LIASNPDIYTHFPNLMGLTSSERDIVLAVLLENHPPEPHNLDARVAVSLYSTDIPLLPFPQSLKSLELQVKGNLSPAFIPALIEPLRHLECLEIRFLCRESHDDVAADDDDGLAVELVAGCTHSPFKLPAFIGTGGIFDDEDDGLVIHQTDAGTVWTLISDDLELSANGVENCDWYEEMRAWILDRPSLEFIVSLWQS